MPAWCSHKPEEGIRSPGTGVTERVVSHHVVLGLAHRSSAGAANGLTTETSLQRP